MKRTKLIASFVACFMCLACLTMGVFAAVNVNFGLTGQLTFNPEGVYVKVSGQMYRGENYGTLAPLTAANYILPEMTNYDEVDGAPAGNLPIPSWTTPNVTLVPGERAVKYRIEVTNVSEAGIKGTATATITGATGTPSVTTAGGVKTSVYTNCTVTEYAQYIQNIQPNDTQVYELVVELNQSATSATINVSISFDFTDDKMYLIEWEGNTYNYVNMGKYPQRYVGNTMNAELEALLQANDPALKETTKVYTTFDYCNLPSSTSAKDATPILVESKEYTYIDGNTYVRMETLDFENSSYTYMNGEKVPAKVQSGDTTKYTAQWYKVEPIQWRVLNPTKIETENAVLLSELALSANTSFYPTYDTSYGDVNNYARSDNAIRNYLTTYFYNQALTSEEQAKVTARNFAEGELEYNGVDETDITSALSDQKVWLPTRADYINSGYGFATSTSTSDDARLCSPSDFALANYSYLYTSSSYTTPARQSGGTVNYWTSSAASGSRIASGVDSSGAVVSYYVSFVTYAARPALLFKL
ncbi:MAG TPA: hypothetical protein IAA62_00325 [Candidatus Caccopulliclostridium gallistercoris]|uniref:Uncharacterized protein n=1 Tax=Candidatus Caccopulliclostridium gallistercoris TaxID=2840719 RepID=A0A9D1NE85_9FIRM|nr:hypothetical protein [Candidatus Caccopulliclostridium gallistercoris]